MFQHITWFVLFFLLVIVSLSYNIIFNVREVNKNQTNITISKFDKGLINFGVVIILAIWALDDYDYDYMNVNQEFLNNAHVIEDNLTTHVNITDFLKPVVLSYHREKISAFTDEMIDKGAVAIEFTTTIK